MKPWRNVLVHLDGKPSTTEALEKSVLVAEAFGGRVLAFDSVERAPFAPLFASAQNERSLEIAAAMRAEQLREALAACAERVPVEATVGRGAPGRALLSCAAQMRTDLILKATSAEEVRQMTASGRAALHLLRASQVPVWLYAPPACSRGRIVAAVNLSGGAPERERLNERVLIAASRLAQLEAAELHVVCVPDRARDRLYECILGRTQYRRYLAEDRDDLRRSLANLMQRLGPHAVPHLVEGNALDELDRLVLELDADLVTLGRDGVDARSGVPDSYRSERLFCRIDRSLLLVTPDAEFARARANPRKGQEAVQLEHRV